MLQILRVVLKASCPNCQICQPYDADYTSLFYVLIHIYMFFNKSDIEPAMTSVLLGVGHVKKCSDTVFNHFTNFNSTILA